MNIKKHVNAGADLLVGPRRRFGALEKEVLEQLSAGDLLVGFLCSARSSKRMYRLAYQRAKARHATKNAIARLERGGFIKRVVGNGDALTLTAMGSSVVRQEIHLLRDAGRRGKKWDGKWRIVSFDIPQEHKPIRDVLRSLLMRAGFKQVQKSVYIHPHTCDALVKLLQEDSRLSKFTFFCTTTMVTRQEAWKKIFQLR